MCRGAEHGGSKSKFVRMVEPSRVGVEMTRECFRCLKAT